MISPHCVWAKVAYGNYEPEILMRGRTMKIKPADKKGRILMELGPGESKLVAQPGIDSLKLKKILAPTDFSECSEKGLRYATAFAEQFRASLTLLNVVEIAYGAGEAAVIDFEKYKKEANEESRRKLAKLVKQSPKSVPTKGIVRTGSPYDEIVRFAQEAETDLIIISTHGRSGLKRFFLGSTAEKIVRHAPCPVLVIREREHEFIDFPEEKVSRRW